METGAAGHASCEVNMKKASAALLFVTAILSACGGSVPDAIPSVPRATRPAQPKCDASVSSRAVDWSTMTGKGDWVKSAALRTQASEALVPDTLYSLLYSTKTIINTFYYGYSTVDLNVLQKTNEDQFRQSKGNLINAVLEPKNDPLIDEPMRKYLDGLGDLHTYYLRPSSYGAVNAVDAGESQPTASLGFTSWIPFREGIGVLLLDVQAGSPAFLSGFRRGDIIERVDGKTLTPQADLNQTYAAYFKIFDEAGAKASPVAVEYAKKGQTSLQVQNLTGAVLPAGEFPWGEMISDGAGSSVYYLRIPSFSARDTGQVVHNLVNEAKAKNANGIVVDLRDNGGGLVIELMAAVGAFAPDKTLQKLEFLDGSDLTFKYDAAQVKIVDNCGGAFDFPALQNPAQWTGKVAILTTKFSASAAEIFPQFVKQTGRATIVGEETVGVGNTAIRIFPISSGRGVSITAARSRDSAGNYLSATAKPDIAQPDDLAKLVQGTDAALESAISTLR
jgi:carboxyl-terminal processing protease